MKKVAVILCLLFVLSGMSIVFGACSSHQHQFDIQCLESRYLQSQATCTEKGVYYYCCECGEKGDKTFQGGVKLGHCIENEKCKRCNFEVDENSLGVNAFDQTIISGYSFRENEKMPIVSIVTNENTEVLTKDYVDCNISGWNCDEEYIFSDKPAQIKVRGNATATYPKKPYRIKFASKQKMFGLNDNLSSKHWVLLAEWHDSTMMEQSLGLFLGKGLLEEDDLYCSDFMHVEVQLNGEYQGVYLLVEQQRVENGRVDINKAEEGNEGVDIGYFIELDGYYTSEDKLQQFEVDYEFPLTIETGENTINFMKGYSIKSDIYSKAQKEYIAKITKNIYDILYDAVYLNHADLNKYPFKTLDENGNIVPDKNITSAKEAVSKVVNIQSFVDAYILNQIAADQDMGWSSLFMSIDMSKSGDKKLTCQAPWDFEHCFGGRNEPFVDVVNKPYEHIHWPHTLSNPWLMILSNEEWFRDLVYHKWTNVKEKGLFLSAVALIETNATIHLEKYKQNYEKWWSSGTYSIDNINPLKEWLYKRVGYLNSYFSTFQSC